MKRTTKSVIVAAVLLALLSAGVSLQMGCGALHPARRPLEPGWVQQAERRLQAVGATREDFAVQAQDGVILRGWKARPREPNRDWVLLFHGVSDNRAGMLAYAALLLRHGYGVVLMDARAHGASDGPMATYGWRERHDTRAIVDRLFASEAVHCLFLLGESMGGSIALQSAAIELRVAGVVAESAFSNLREVSYDYTGLRISHWLGRTLFRPAALLAVRAAEKEGGFRAEDVSPEKAVTERAFPVLLICGTRDRNIPARHTRRIFAAAAGSKQMWLVPGAGHTGALGTAPGEFERRVVGFYRQIHEERK